MFKIKIRSLQHAAHALLARQTHLLARGASAQPPPPSSHHPFDHPPPDFDFDKAMANDKEKGDVHSEETILFLFLTFGILIVLILIFLLLGFQTYLSWRIAHSLLESDDVPEGGEGKGFRRWDRERKERKRALRALEKGRSVRASWGYGSGSRTSKRDDEEMGMSGARGSSVLLDKMPLKDGEEKKPFWSIKRWI
ncbi:hypothetical protein E8E12_001734 [Didymella heteroderae]|uniref:Uncharacterized protein n=1 Tax=Didymella heteroderae TaxID=1769908 RepID=A0A9P5BXD5_9PLEO|nr:hypothetical protein E8E12_001734 [Didymella heteroderae]